MSGALLRLGVFAWVGLLVALPVLTLVGAGLRGGPSALWAAVTEPAALDAIGLSLGTAAVATLVNSVVGTAIAWVLVRWDVPGRRLIAALVDLPLAIPTLVAGMLILALLGPQTWLGAALGEVGVKVAFARPGIVLALL